ncbi:hypothetical protein FQA39_LY18974 [Lamprigera yunnana]|nr:hypothetical protein FQA39_LY18974 [Lamprigera yunnana]
MFTIPALDKAAIQRKSQRTGMTLPNPQHLTQISAYVKKNHHMGVPTAIELSFLKSVLLPEPLLFAVIAFSQNWQKQQLAKTILPRTKSPSSLWHHNGLDVYAEWAVAATFRVGNQLGLRDFKLYVKQISASTFYLNNQAVIILSGEIIELSSIFPTFDGIQLVVLALLRGMQDVKIPSIITFISYWLIATSFRHTHCALFLKCCAIWNVDWLDLV